MDLFRRLFSQSGSEPVDEDTHPLVSAAQPTTDNLIEADDDELAAAVITQEVAPLEPVTGPPADGSATRPLPQEQFITRKNEHLTFGQSTDVGMMRTNNQDSVFSFFSTSRSAEERPDFGLFIVADGMGGHHDGEKASAMAARIVASYITNKFYLPMISNDTENDTPPITETMINALQRANSEVMAKVPDGGTTLTAAAVVGDLAYIAHVGDSRAYLVSKDGCEQITRDHSLVQRLIELAHLTPEEAAGHPQGNVLYRALGQADQIDVDAITRRLPPNSRLLLCSDGLWNQVMDKDIRDIVMTNEDPQQACDKLVALANTRGGSDNITAILLRIPTK